MKYSLSLVWLVLIARSICGQSVFELAGNWQGTGHIVVNWCTQDTLFFDIDITTDGDIAGHIGDAIITSADIEKNNIGENDYVLVLKLKGSLIECEGITRSVMRIGVKRVDNELHGSFQSSGKLFGKKEDGILSGTGLILRYK